MASIDKQYKRLLLDILLNGYSYEDKSRKIMCRQIPEKHLVINIDRNPFPLLSIKKTNYRWILHELKWMLSGSTNIHYLKDNNVPIWNKDAESWAKKNNSSTNYIGRVYGAQWRNWGSTIFNEKKFAVDQISNLITDLRAGNIFNRMHLVTAYNPAELKLAALPPCHWGFQIIPESSNKFSLKWFQRSTDAFLGLPFDITLYAFLGKLIESTTGLKFVRLIGDLSNIHLYWPHIPLAQEVMHRDDNMEGPIVTVEQGLNIDTWQPLKDVTINYYQPLPYIKAEMYSKI